MSYLIKLATKWWIILSPVMWIFAKHELSSYDGRMLWIGAERIKHKIRVSGVDESWGGESAAKAQWTLVVGLDKHNEVFLVLLPSSGCWSVSSLCISAIVT